MIQEDGFGLKKIEWEVIANYPNGLYKKGDRIVTYESGNAYIVACGDKHDGTYQSDDGCLQDYPEIFKKLNYDT